MKVIFLDVDGVLSSFGERGLCALRLDMFAALVKATGAEVVLSSTWRHPHCREQRMRLQREFYARGVEFYGMTPVLDAPIGTGLLVKGHLRGDEIQVWLNGHRNGPDKVTSFVILDDDPNDEMGRLKPHLVKCDGYAGLTRQNCDDVVRILTEPEGDGGKGISKGKTPDLSNTQNV